MKKILKEYYGINIEYSRIYREGLIFHVNGDYYYFCKSYLTEEEVYNSYKLYLLLKSKDILLHDFIFNKDNKLLSKDYVLLKLNYMIDDIELNDLKKTNIELTYDLKEDFYNLWINKIDYYEEHLFNPNNDYFINYSFDYFVGVSEILLELYKNNKQGLNNNYVVHRTFYSLCTIDYYNPLNIVIGDRLKDYSFYIKLTNNWSLLYTLLRDSSYEEKKYLFIRLSFPFYYFYCLNIYLNDGDSRNELLSVVDNIDFYEKYLCELENIIGVRFFYWIKKDN